MKEVLNVYTIITNESFSVNGENAADGKVMNQSNIFQLFSRQVSPRFAALFIGLGLALASQPANASVIYDIGVAVNNGDSGYYSSQLQGWRVFDDFSLSQSATVGSVWFQEGTTSSAAGQLNSFSFSIFGSSAGQPGSLLFSQTFNPGQYTATPNSISSYPFGPFYDISINLSSGVTLGAGNYFVSFYGLGSTDFRTPNVGSGNSFLQQLGSSSFNTPSGNTPFRLMTAAPVPDGSNVMGLFGFGLLFLVGLRRLTGQRKN